MADILNLNRARKAKRRDDATHRAAANRAAFGRTKAEKRGAANEVARQADILDGARREP